MTSNLLSKTERLHLLDTIEMLELVSSEEQFFACTNGQLQYLLPHERSFGGMARFSGEHVEPLGMLMHNFPQEYIEEIRQPDGTLDSQIMRRWRVKREPLLVDLESLFGMALSYITRIKKYGFRNGAVHGMVDVHGEVTSYFSFVDLPEKPGPRHAYLLNVLVPHLHVALSRSLLVAEGLTQLRSESHDLLNDRQKEILQWVYQGKTNLEIAQILHLSVDTVKYHVTNILSKLCVVNRAQAVAKALSLRIIES